MSYVRHPMAHLIYVDAAAARVQLTKAFREACANRGVAARSFQCKVDTFVRWCAVVGLDLDVLEYRARTEGWHHGHHAGKRRRRLKRLPASKGPSRPAA